MRIPSCLLFSVFLLSANGAPAMECPDVPIQDATRQLAALLAASPELSDDLATSIARGQEINPDPNTNPVRDIDSYLGFVNALLTYDPRNIDTGVLNGKTRVSMDGAKYCNWNILDLLAYSYFLVDRQLTSDPRGQIQFMSEPFGAWMRNLAQAWGDYLETPDSARYVPEFTTDPNFGDWYCPPTGGYATFQDFFTRELCADQFPTGSRPVEGYDDPNTVVSIGDSTSAGWWPISSNGRLVTTYDTVAQSGVAIKGKLYSSVPQFILGAPGETVLETFGEIDPEIFNGGVWTHQFLNVNNYHRLHVPVAGEIVYLRHFQSATRMKSGWVQGQSADEVSFYDPEDTADWQFGQTRMVIGIRMDNGQTVVISPMGMAQVSAIVKRDWVIENARTDKGWEFANFAFGGSDFVVIFQPDADFVLTAPVADQVPPGAGENYSLSLQGSKYGCFGGADTCGDAPAMPPPYPGSE